MGKYKADFFQEQVEILVIKLYISSYFVVLTNHKWTEAFEPLSELPCNGIICNMKE